MIQITQSAQASLISLLSRREASSAEGLRLSVKKGGCAGLQYTMEVAHQEDGDLCAGDAHARVFIAPEAIEYLQGMTLDYSISLADSGFKIRNPNAERSCGCGTSFQPKKQGDPNMLQQGEECTS